MANNSFQVGGREFKTAAERDRALRDFEIIKKLKQEMRGADNVKLKSIRNDLENGKYRFFTILGEDFIDELDDAIRRENRSKRVGNNSGKIKSTDKKSDKKSERKAAFTEDEDDEAEEYKPISSIPKKRRPYRTLEEMSPEEQEIELYARKLLKQRELRRKIFTIGSVAIAVVSLGFFAVNSILDYKKSQSYNKLSDIRKHAAETNVNPNLGNSGGEDDFVIHFTDTNKEIPDILPEFKDMMAVNSNIIGWITIADTKIDYPVMQNGDNEYYLNHDMNQNYDRNGTIFLDKDCDVLKPSTNLILYGHHMRSGNMFGNLNLYQDKAYFEKHRYITFDTIYEYGTYEVMYVFRSHVYDETEIAFKYYQFIDANGEIEFNSYMNDMSEMSLYDTGVTAVYGDRLLTLSTCDYHEKDGRFVVVAKKIL